MPVREAEARYGGSADFGAGSRISGHVTAWPAATAESVGAYGLTFSFGWIHWI